MIPKQQVGFRNDSGKTGRFPAWFRTWRCLFRIVPNTLHFQNHSDGQPWWSYFRQHKMRVNRLGLEPIVARSNKRNASSSISYERNHQKNSQRTWDSALLWFSRAFQKEKHFHVRKQRQEWHQVSRENLPLHVGKVSRGFQLHRLCFQRPKEQRRHRQSRRMERIRHLEFFHARG